MPKYSITPSYHKVKNKPIWLVKPLERLDTAEYRSVESKIKQIGGYYSRFTRSFVFETEPSEEQLNEVFGDTQSISDKAVSAGVSQSKIALIPMGGSFQSVDRRTLRNEYNAGKLLVGQRKYFDAMVDMTRTISDSEIKWKEKDAGFEKEFDYSNKAYVSGNEISFGDYKAKYKPEIVIPEKPKPKRQSSLNYFVNVEYQKQKDESTEYELDRVDSNSNDHQKGDRVVTAMYGNKYCGFIIDKIINKYVITSWVYGGGKSAKEEESIRYVVQLDNGVKQTYATFKIDTDNECEEISADAVLYNDSFMLAEQFWSAEIVRTINTINSLRRQKSARKKAEYAMQDQKSIDRNETLLFRNFGIWLGWEKENYEYSRQITGETMEEQIYRTEKWINEYDIKPEELLRPKDRLLKKLTSATELLLPQ